MHANIIKNMSEKLTKMVPKWSQNLSKIDPGGALEATWEPPLKQGASKTSFLMILAPFWDPLWEQYWICAFWQFSQFERQRWKVARCLRLRTSFLRVVNLGPSYAPPRPPRGGSKCKGGYPLGVPYVIIFGGRRRGPQAFGIRRPPGVRRAEGVRGQ